MRKRVASVVRRIRGSPNTVLNTVVDRFEGRIQKHWNDIHSPFYSNVYMLYVPTNTRTKFFVCFVFLLTTNGWLDMFRNKLFEFEFELFL
jgi:hypothetical protein